jgi:hypothetical protein
LGLLREILCKTSLQKVLANANKTIEKSTKFINKIKSRQIASANRAKSLPENATIRIEYIKFGKQMCELKHGIQMKNDRTKRKGLFTNNSKG